MSETYTDEAGRTWTIRSARDYRGNLMFVARLNGVTLVGDTVRELTDRIEGEEA